MENKQIEPTKAFEIIFQMTGQLTLNREQHAILDASLRSLAQLIPQEEGDQTND